MSTAIDLHTRLGQRHRMAPRPAADVEHRHAGLEAEHLGEEPDLLGGAHGERVPQVRRAEVVRDVLEPVPVGSGGVAGRHHVSPSPRPRTRRGTG